MAELCATLAEAPDAAVGGRRCHDAQRAELVARKRLLALPWPGAAQQRVETMAAASIEDQRRIEQADTLPFETYRQQDLSAERLGV